ncbi:DEAD/DEAH box helicase [bacterium]|nr:DEAD/DEAH box helicase [bacterium]
MNFESMQLHETLWKGLKSAGYKTPTPIQSLAIPPLMEGRDVIATAQTGTGKTAAFVLPILQKLLQSESKKQARALVITPTRELAEQIHEVIRVLGKHTGIRSITIYGGMSMQNQLDGLRKGVDILVACPGRLLDHVERKTVDLKHIEWVVLDEADRMLDMGFLPPIRKLLRCVPNKRQTALFSATFTRVLENLIANNMRNPKRLAVSIEAPAETVTHTLYPISRMMKSDLLVRVLKNMKTQSVLIFTRTKHRADGVARKLKRAGFTSDALHANRTQGQRMQILKNFRKGHIPILVATDIAARGLDIESISHVINYDMPDTATSYIHRIGRTGRAARNGDALTMVTWEDNDIIRDVEKLLGRPLERKVLSGFPYDEPLPKECQPPETFKPKTLGSRRTVTVRRRL